MLIDLFTLASLLPGKTRIKERYTNITNIIHANCIARNYRMLGGETVRDRERFCCANAAF
jgi:hypothetical protein